MKPQRIQRKRTAGWKMPPNTVYVGRPSRWGNPYKIGFIPNFSAKDAVMAFRGWFTRNPAYRRIERKFGKPPVDEIDQLRGKNLACWCRLDQPCHADVLLELANGKQQ